MGSSSFRKKLNSVLKEREYLMDYEIIEVLGAFHQPEYSGIQNGEVRTDWHRKVPAPDLPR